MACDDDADADPTRDTATSSGYRLASTVVAASRDQRYVRGEEVARGGLGRVAIAVDHKLQRRVALKSLPGATAASFAREALVTARLSHPGIISVFDSGTSETGEPYLVLPFLDGTTLADRIASCEAIEARLGLLPNLLAVADALGYAHAEGVIHRDIKPANIMIGPHGETVVIDWGAAYDTRASDDSRGETMFVGTPRFTSVEQARGEPPVPAFDVYSLGTTIATVLTGEAPFAGMASDVALDRLRGGETGVPPMPVGVASDLASIVAKATAPLAERYPDAGALADDLRRFIAGQLVSARRYTTRELIARWMRLHRGWVVAGASAIVLAVIAVVAIVHQRDVAIREREAAVAREHDLVWLQARSHLRTDPTTTLAWLKAYPTSAPHQDQLLALVDEAEGRGVARHVWHVPSAPVDATFADDDALIVALRDRSIVRIDPVSGARSQVATLPHVPSFIRARGPDVFAVDEAGDVWRARAGALANLGRLDPPGHAVALHLGPDGSLEVAVDDGHGRWIGRPPPDLSRYVQVDDAHDAGVALGVTANGEVELVGSPPRPIGHFAPHVWVRGSTNGSHYVAIEPRADAVGIWLGDANGTTPIELARGAPCKGENRELHAEPSDDGRTVVVFRCGVLTMYDAPARRAIEIAEPERVFQFAFAPDGRSLIVGRDDRFDLIDLATGSSRRLDIGSTTRLVGFAADSRMMFSAGVEQGVRVWALAGSGTRAARIGEVSAPVALAVIGNDVLGLRRSLGCALWDVRRRAIVAATPDRDNGVWPVDASDDGTTCMFPGDSTVDVVDTRGAHHVLPSRTCVLSGDGAAAWCVRGAELVEIALASGREMSSRSVAGRIVGLTRYRGAPVALVIDGEGCRLEMARGDRLVSFDGERACALLGTASATAIIVAVADGQIAVWNELGVTRVSSSLGRVEVGVGFAAALDEDAIAIWDLRTHRRVAGPPQHARAVERAAWSARGILASSDDEVVQLWDAASGRTRMLVSPHVSSLAWSLDGTTLYTTDGRVIDAWPIDLATGASAAEVRARLERLTTAQIRGDHAETP